MFWLGLTLPIDHWLGLSLAMRGGITAQTLTGPWFAALLAAAFCLGAATPDLGALWRGVAVGLSISSAVAVAQVFGWNGIPSMEKPAGLLYNSAIQAGAIALVIIALVCGREWRYIPALLPGFLLAQSRGGLLVVAGGMVACFVGWRYVLLLLALAAAVTLTRPGPSDVERIMIWHAAFGDIGWFGHGSGSFANLLFWSGGDLHYPGHAHNDYLQLAYEFGVWALPAYVIYAATLANTCDSYWPAFVGFAIAGMFFFPLYAPITGVMGAVLAGHILRRPPGFPAFLPLLRGAE